MLDFQFSAGRKGQEGQRASRCRNSWRSVKPLLRYGDISIFHDGGSRHLGFLKCGNFRDGRVKSIQMRHHAKFRGDRPNRCWDTVMY